jgi:hypothetical protein
MGMMEEEAKGHINAQEAVLINGLARVTSQSFGQFDDVSKRRS